MMQKSLLLLLTLAFPAAPLWNQASEQTTADKQVVLETELGVIIVELFPEAAPQHVARFRERVQSGFYDGTTFHRAIPLGIIQGGDPLSKDPEHFEKYGTGGLFELEMEANSISHTRGTVSAVLVPGEPDSAGSQFFICVSDQTQLDGHFTAFGRVVEGMSVAETISQLATDAEDRIQERIEIDRAYERMRPPEEQLPFAEPTVEELSRYHVLIYTELGEIEIAFYPEDAPEHVRRFLQLAELGLYDGTTFHRIVPNFVIQGGVVRNRQDPIPERYEKILTPLKAEFNEHPHIRGSVSMARTDDPDSAVDSFFIVLDRAEYLDGQYTVFGHVVKGMDTVDGISQVPVRGESPILPFEIDKMEVSAVP